jgi:tetratricopeptide (TPR) repeat protein
MSTQADVPVPDEPDEPETPAQAFFDLKEALVPDGAPEQERVSSHLHTPDTGQDMSAQADAPVPDEPETPAQAFFDPKEVLVPDGAPEQESGSARPGESHETARSFFDLQAALTMDESLEFDHESPSESLLNAEQERAPFSVLDVVKDIAEQDPRQDTPLFHFNLGVAYMQCAEYEQAVDEFLSALYGTSDKIGCYVRLAECSLKLHRRELACGFLREALDHQSLSPEQEPAIRKLLDDISGL